MSKSNRQYSSFVHCRTEPEQRFGGPSMRNAAQDELLTPPSVWERPEGWPTSGDSLAALNKRLHAAAHAPKAAKKGRASAPAWDVDGQDETTRHEKGAQTVERERRAAGWWPEAEYTPLHLFAEPDANEALRRKIGDEMAGVRGRAVQKHCAEARGERLLESAIRLQAIDVGIAFV
ncbi:protein of unknown function [Burkholderia multivorans]